MRILGIADLSYLVFFLPIYLLRNLKLKLIQLQWIHMKIHFQILVLENTIPCLKYKIHQELEVIALHEVVELKCYTIKLFEEVKEHFLKIQRKYKLCLLYTSPSPRDS